MSELGENYQQVLLEAQAIWEARQRQYGRTPFEIEDILTLIKIKLLRLQNGYSEDSLLDILNYAAIGIMVMKGEWN